MRSFFILHHDVAAERFPHLPLIYMCVGERLHCRNCKINPKGAFVLEQHIHIYPIPPFPCHEWIKTWNVSCLPSSSIRRAAELVHEWICVRRKKRANQHFCKQKGKREAKIDFFYFTKPSQSCYFPHFISSNFFNLPPYIRMQYTQHTRLWRWRNGRINKGKTSYRAKLIHTQSVWGNAQLSAKNIRLGSLLQFIIIT